jgi:cytochrome b pre-mRNA-processing protein 3
LHGGAQKGKPRMLKQLFTRKSQPAQALYAAIVAQARRPVFYAEWGVPDTVDGRFDMLSVVMFAVLNQLKDENDPELRQHLIDLFFADMDRGLREMGVGDLTVGKKVRKMAESFYGRMDAYRTATDEQTLEQAIARNVYADADASHAPQLAAWLRRSMEHLKTVDIASLRNGKWDLLA